jgi:hypothetical protein
VTVVTLDVPGSGVRVGDDLDFLGTPHRISRIVPYRHAVVTKGELWRIAYAGVSSRGAIPRRAWGITLEPGGSYTVTRVVAEP